MLIIVGCGILAWKKRGHGLTSGPRETASAAFLNEVSILFQYPPRSASALLDGTLPLRSCAGRFACPGGGVADLVTEVGEDVPDGIEVDWARGKNSRTPREEEFWETRISQSCLEEIVYSWFSGMGAC